MNLAEVDVIKKEIKDWQEDIHDNEYDADKFDFVFDRIYEILENVPSIDAAEVVHGKWVNKQGGFWETSECSICGAHFPTVGGRMYYCPNCGAKMMEVAE